MLLISQTWWSGTRENPHCRKYLVDFHPTLHQSRKLYTTLQSAHVAPEIYKLRPDYRALLMVVEGVPPGPSDDGSEALVLEAEASAKHLLAKHAVGGIPHIAAWRETYRAYAAKPQKTRNSLEALTRRAAAAGGLPRVNRPTDIYNAVSAKHQVRLGGEDPDRYDGSPFLTRASGREEFRTLSGGEARAAPGEPIWCDDAGITCRRWNWRQGPRTALTDDTTRVLFILDALEPLSDEALARAAEELALALGRLSPEVRVTQRILSALDAAGGGS
ncbi:hypothetical protein MAC_07214 [Metarhizium acridum CQMa 102]|uniref:B3/B4 tRNA-binding domain-containing protein n=1 Tax=Metarhizium acridum (strain CQMa 102) TaxID=655827 RepID=E9EBG6_METAQ|nr:uncharacterized protein MAC_07214 [Metarhizium acridum CQMa 102]EFY86713.1 hypothetical protein MAC_07214 [Metarhizium acridum CQMa 102]